MRRGGRPLMWIGGGLCFGVFVALLKGDGAGTRQALGNMSAPWLVLPYLAGRRRGTVVAALACRAGTALASVARFYLCDSARYVGIVTTHSAPLILRIVIGAAVAGPVMGLLGYWNVQARSTLAGCVVGFALMLEPMATRSYQYGSAYGAVNDHSTIYRIEALAGAIRIARRPTRPRTQQHP